MGNVKALVVALAAAASAAAQGGARWDEGAPRINGPKVYGATPGREFLYAFPTCGSRDGLKFSVSGGRLPPGAGVHKVPPGWAARSFHPALIPPFMVCRVFGEPYSTSICRRTSRCCSVADSISWERTVCCCWDSILRWG